jgi:hypothetical protein
VERCHLGGRIRRPVGGVELEVVALQEYGTPPPLAYRGGQDDGGVFVGALVGIGHLALRDLENHGPDVALESDREDGSGGEV